MNVLEVPTLAETEHATEVKRLIDELDSPLPWRRSTARKRLERMGEAVVSPLLRLFVAEHRLREAHLRRIGPLMIFGLIASAALLIFNRVSFRSDLLSAFSSAALIVLVSGLFTGVANGYGRRHKRLARVLATFDSVEAVGPLAEALEFDEDGIVLFPETQKAAQKGLTRLLPLLRSEDRYLLEDRHWPNIIKALYSADTEFTLAVLKAWEHVGDERALPTVRRMAHGLAITEAARRIRETAQSCLTVLEARVAKETAPRTLLRASCSAEWTSETLLRPAADASDPSHHQELLRVVSEGEAVERVEKVERVEINEITR